MPHLDQTHVVLRRAGTRRALAGVVAGGTVAALAVTGLVAGPAAPAAADLGSECSAVNGTDDDSETHTDASWPLGRLQVEDAQEAVRRTSGREPGEGIGVAVLDSGVANERVPATPGYRVPGVTDAVEHWHGTAMAALVAGRDRDDGGPVGVAPAASLLDVRVYDAVDDDELVELDADGLADALRTVAGVVGLGPDQVRVVLVPHAVEDTRALRAAVRDVTRQGGVVVAPSGDVPEDEDEEEESDAPDVRDPDAAEEVFPAGYSADDDRVLAVGSTGEVPEGEDDSSGLLASSAIDVVAPSAAAAAYAVNGTACVLPGPSSETASALVTGVLALLWSAYPDENADQVLARLVATAAGGSGPEGPRNRRVGLGVVQPLEAVTRNLRPDRRGDLGQSMQPERVVEPAPLPPVEPDELRSTRRDAVWWGLGAGAVLLVAVLLRPLLARRR